MKANKLQQLRENYNCGVREVTFSEWLDCESRNDPDFFRWFYDREDLSDFENPNEEEWEEFMEEISIIEGTKESGLPKNDYRPNTGIRENIVSAVCKHIVSETRARGAKGDTYSINVKDGMYKSPTFFLNFNRHNETSGFSNDYAKDNYSIRLRTSEMREAFNRIQNAGYYIFARFNTTEMVHEYIFSVRDYLGQFYAKRVEFTTPID